MERKRPPYLARLLAVAALLGALALVVVTIATNGDGDDDGDSKSKSAKSGTTREGQRALNRGVWVVEDGDTLVAISEAVGIELDELVALNPDLDPQALIAGQRVSLRQGRAGEDEDSATTTDSSGDPADQFGDGSVGQDDPGSSDTTTEP